MYKVMTVFGIRPDFIRASVLLKKMIKHPDIKLDFVYTGQHYDDELMGVFFREMKIPPPTIILDTSAPTHPQQHAKLISQLEKAIEVAKPDCVMFLGDANAVIGCITPLKMGIPIVHVEAGMRSHDWNMPEERNRRLIDAVSDVLYVYQHDYKIKLVREGVCPTKIEVVGNTIVDVLNEHMDEIDRRTPEVLRAHGVEAGKYALMTMHRNENISNAKVGRHMLWEVSKWAQKNKLKVVLPVMPRLRPILEAAGTYTRRNFIETKPLGFLDFIALEKNAKIEFTDSGTNQEVASILGTPCVVLRENTERPETFECKTTVLAGGLVGSHADLALNAEHKKISLGDGNSAELIVEDLVRRLKAGIRNSPPYLDKFILRNWSN